jgi:uncharacterized protein YjiS (DUF1127 family)
MTPSIIHAAALEGAPARRPAFLAGLARWLKTASRRVAMRRARRELFAMPDFMLADIGLTRGEIASAVRHGRPLPGRG